MNPNPQQSEGKAGKSLRHNDPSTMLAWGALRRVKIPLWVYFTAATFVIAGAIPLVVAIRERANWRKPDPKVHFFQDMDNQPKLKAQQASRLFADGRANRPQVVGTVARGELRLDDHYELGFVMINHPVQSQMAPRFFDDFPASITVDEPFIRRGQKMYNITCSVCHGKDGGGLGPIHTRALTVGAGATGWVQPTDLHSDSVRNRPNGHIYNTINNGIRNMAGYGTQLEPQDRWAIVAYVRALQLSRAMPAEVVKAELVPLEQTTETAEVRPDSN
jgi:mono/diheme cytochrome c family protein